MSAESIGIFDIKHEPSEVRAFPSHFVNKLYRDGWQIFINKEYGLGLKIPSSEYLNAGAELVRLDEIAKCPFQLTIRFPEEVIDKLPSGTVLMSMAHFDTRPKRVEQLGRLGIKAIALDLIKNDDGKRCVENLSLVAKNAIDAGFKALKKFSPEIFERDEPIRVRVIGRGNIGSAAANFAQNYNDGQVDTFTFGRDTTSDMEKLRKILQESDMLVDATNRRGSTQPIITNNLLGETPKHCVVVDCCVDPYVVEDGVVIASKGIEGIPQGNLDKYIIGLHDLEWETIQKEVPHKVKRTTVSCYSWPGITPIESMRIYSDQIYPFLKILQGKGYDGISISSENPDERALVRGTLKHFMEHTKKN